MKNRVVIAVFIFFIPFVQASDHGDLYPVDSFHVLFLGNSYTGANALPQIFLNLSESGGRQVEVDANTPGGYTLEQHSTNAVSLEKISQGIWDYVVLQEQSQFPTIEYYRETSMYPAARLLDSLITDQGADTLFFMTWGRRFGGKQDIGGHTSPEFFDFFEMQESLRSAYVDIAWELSARVAPVGMAWGLALSRNPFVDLWSADNSHPTFKGSYLAACVFYAIIFDDNPVGLAYRGNLSVMDATFLQNAAYHSVISDLLKTRILPPQQALSQ